MAMDEKAGLEVEASEKISSLVDVEYVIDADGHLMEKFGDVLPHIDDEFDYIRELFELAERPFSDVISQVKPTPTAPYSGWQDQLEAGDSPESKIDQMEQHGIDYSVLSPGTALLINTIQNKQFGVAWANGLNSYVLDTFSDDYDRFRNLMTIYPRKPDRAAEEIDDRAGEDSIVGITMPPAGMVPPAGDPYYEQIYDAAQDHGLPIVLHTNSAATHCSFPVQSYWNETYASEHVTVHPFTQMWNLTSLMFQGIPEVYPDLEFVFQEGGIGWVPYTIFRLDDHYLEMSHEIPRLKKLPSEYIRDRFSFTTQPLGLSARDDRHIAWFIDMIGPESVMFSADLPHPDFDTPEELFNRINRYFIANDVNKIMGRNAIGTFGLDL